MKKYNDKGEELMDDTPVAMPVGFKRPESLQAQMIRLIRSEEFRRSVSSRGHETFEEAEDFDCPDDPVDPHSPWELQFDPITGREVYPPEAAMIQSHLKNFDAEVKKQKNAKKRKAPSEPETKKPTQELE